MSYLFNNHSNIVQITYAVQPGHRIPLRRFIRLRQNRGPRPVYEAQVTCDAGAVRTKSSDTQTRDFCSQQL
jgi:hypothetical protein